MNSMDLKMKLSGVSPEKLISIIVKAYSKSKDVRHEVDLLFQSSREPDELLQEFRKSLLRIGRLPPSAYKDQLEAYTKAEKDKQKRIDAYFLFADTALDAYLRKECDHRMIMVASSYYGKAVRMMDQSLWEGNLERSFSLAERFYKIPMDTALQAVRYYQEKKDLMAGRLNGKALR